MIFSICRKNLLSLLDVTACRTNPHPGPGHRFDSLSQCGVAPLYFRTWENRMLTGDAIYSGRTEVSPSNALFSASLPLVGINLTVRPSSFVR